MWFHKCTACVCFRHREIAIVGVVCAHEPTSMHHVQRMRMLRKRCVCSFKLVSLTSDARDNDDWCDRILRHQCLVASRAIVAKSGSRSAATSLKLATTTIQTSSDVGRQKWLDNRCRTADLDIIVLFCNRDGDGSISPPSISSDVIEPHPSAARHLQSDHGKK